MRDEFVLVKSEDELRPCMCVELRNCMVCGNRRRFILNTKETSTDPMSAKWAWTTLPKNEHFDEIRLGVAIRERRLFRMRDDDTAADETATTKRKERVR